jgi:hypothetical protein
VWGGRSSPSSAFARVGNVGGERRRRQQQQGLRRQRLALLSYTPRAAPSKLGSALLIDLDRTRRGILRLLPQLCTTNSVACRFVGVFAAPSQSIAGMERTRRHETSWPSPSRIPEKREKGTRWGGLSSRRSRVSCRWHPTPTLVSNGLPGQVFSSTPRGMFSRGLASAKGSPTSLGSLQGNRGEPKPDRSAPPRQQSDCRHPQQHWESVDVASVHSHIPNTGPRVSGGLFVAYRARGSGRTNPHFDFRHPHTAAAGVGERPPSVPSWRRTPPYTARRTPPYTGVVRRCCRARRTGPARLRSVVCDVSPGPNAIFITCRMVLCPIGVVRSCA